MQTAYSFSYFILPSLSSSHLPLQYFSAFIAKGDLYLSYSGLSEMTINNINKPPGSKKIQPSCTFVLLIIEILHVNH